MSSSKIPIISLGNDYLISFQGDVRDNELSRLKSELFERLSEDDIRCVILEVSGLSTMDSFMARIFNELATGSRLNGVETYLVGIQPEVAMTLVEMGLSIPDIKAEQSVDRVMKKLNR
jgi:rsbT antagonist protein RsbS